jgi:hypothetical protein
MLLRLRKTTKTCEHTPTCAILSYDAVTSRLPRKFSPGYGGTLAPRNGRLTQPFACPALPTAIRHQASYQIRLSILGVQDTRSIRASVSYLGLPVQY